MLRELRRCALVAFAAALLAGALLFIFLFFAGSWLRAAEPPRKADAIVVLAGSFERSLYAADLYNQRYAPKVYLSVPAREAGNLKVEAIGIVLPDPVEIHKQILLKKGVSADAILTFGRGSLSTAEEAEVLRGLHAQTAQRFLIVTSPYHARRARLIFDRAFHGLAAEITVVATPYEEFREDWWRSQDSAVKTLLETAKIAYYVAGGTFRSGAARVN